jgi:hypothetical protein
VILPWITNDVPLPEPPDSAEVIRSIEAYRQRLLDQMAADFWIEIDERLKLAKHLRELEGE